MMKDRNLTCKICNNELSSFIMNNRLVCLKCDELLFDIEIESGNNDEEQMKDLPQENKKTVE